MTQFENLEILYNQFFNLTDEIRQLIEKEEYAAASEKIEYKEQLIIKLVNTKKTVKCTEEEKLKMIEFEEKIKEKDKENIEFLTSLREDLKEQLTVTKQKIKVSSVYRKNAEQKTGIFCDLSE